MIRYRRVWCGFWSVLAAIGVGLAVLEWSAVTVLITIGLVALGCWLVRSLGPEAGAPGWVQGLFAHPLAIALGAVTLWSVSAVSAPLALLLVLIAILTSPVVAEHVGRSLHRSPPTEQATEKEIDDAATLTPPEALGPLMGLDDRQLCRLWRESFWALGSTAPPEAVLRVVALREACLDELERRHAGALSAWLANGARASSGPEKYLRPGRGGSDAA